MNRLMPAMRVLVAAMIVAGQALLATSAPAYQGDVWLDESFDSAPTVWTSNWYDAAVGSRNRFSSIPGGVDGNALKVSIPAGSHFGSAAHYKFADNGQAEPTDLYYRYFLRIPTGFVNYGRGKLPGPAGLYASSGRNGVKPTDANPGWSARMVFSPTYDGRDGSYTQLGFYPYHRDQPGSDGEILMWDPQTAALKHGEWSCVEGHVSMNTPGVANGVLEGWVDEQLAFYQSDFKFRGTTDPATAVKSMWLDVYYGGDANAPGSLSFEFDSLVLSSERIGCGLGSGRFYDTGSSVHADNIERLAEARITLGCNPPTNDRYCPTEPVTRGQMAAFLTRALNLPPDTTNRFTDDNGSVFEAQIQSLAAARITLGCNPPTNDRYCPDQTVTREQMASFLARALSLPPAPDYEPPLPFEPAVPAGFDAVVPVGWSIQAVSNSQPLGARILIEAGTHYRQTVIPKTGQVFVGEPGAILDGVGDYQWAFGGSSSGATVEGLEIMSYGTAVNPTGSDWFVSGNVFHDNIHGVASSAAGIRISDNVMHHHLREAILLTGGSSSEISGNVVSYSNQTKETIYNGGIALRGVAGAQVIANTIRDNYGFGIRIDGGSRNTVVTGNTVTDNWGSGIFSDDAYATVISDNALTRNGLNPALAASWGAGIIVRGPDAEIISNSLDSNNAGILIVEVSTPSGPLGPYTPANSTVLDNSMTNSGLAGIKAWTVTVLNSATVDRNHYQHRDPDIKAWLWNATGAPQTWAEWRAFGNDPNGSFASK